MTSIRSVGMLPRGPDPVKELILLFSHTSVSSIAQYRCSVHSALDKEITGGDMCISFKDILGLKLVLLKSSEIFFFVF